MSFWGVELKSGIPTRLSFSGQPKKTLRITQATLGSGTRSERVFVECKVAGKGRILICSIVPQLNESCPIDLSFKQSDQAVLSVVGPRSVYLAGYYTRKHRRSTSKQLPGEDLGEVDTEEEEELDDSVDDSMRDFIVSDDDLDFASPHSPVSDTIVFKTRECKGRVKKRRQVVSSDSEGEEATGAWC